jgi:uncharacterized protein YacL
VWREVDEQSNQICFRCFSSLWGNTMQQWVEALHRTAPLTSESSHKIMTYFLLFVCVVVSTCGISMFKNVFFFFSSIHIILQVLLWTMPKELWDKRSESLLFLRHERKQKSLSRSLHSLRHSRPTKQVSEALNFPTCSSWKTHAVVTGPGIYGKRIWSLIISDHFT